MPPALGAWSLSHWTTREISERSSLTTLSKIYLVVISVTLLFYLCISLWATPRDIWFPWPGIEPIPSVRALSPNHWTANEFLVVVVFSYSTCHYLKLFFLSSLWWWKWHTLGHPNNNRTCRRWENWQKLAKSENSYQSFPRFLSGVCRPQIGTCRECLPSISARIKSCAALAADLQHRLNEFKVESRNEAFCALGNQRDRSSES